MLYVFVIVVVQVFLLGGCLCVDEDGESVNYGGQEFNCYDLMIGVYFILDIF